MLLLLYSVVAVSSQVPSKKMDAATIYEKAIKSIVVVVCSDASGKVWQGSGVVLGGNGIIATNFHVCGNATAARIKLNNGDIYDDVAVMETDDRKDITILKIKAVGLSVLPMADSDQLKIGESVFAIGAPLGLEGTITTGIVSSVRPASEMFSWAEGFRIIQISAPVTPGNSGGPILNDRGEVLGLVFARRPEGQNLNAAIPINYVAPLVHSSNQGRVLKRLVELRERANGEGSSFGTGPAARSGTLEDLGGVYTGQWASSRYEVAGTLALTVTVANNTATIMAVFTGSEYFNQDELITTLTSMGAGVWKMDYVGKKSKIRGTGIFKDGRFVGDYKFKKLIWTDVGQWVLQLSR